MSNVRYIGLDVHKDSIMMSIVESGDSEAKNAERTARHQLSKFLLRNDRMHRDGKEWTAKHMIWGRNQKFDDACRQCVMDDDIKAVGRCDGSCEANEQERRDASLHATGMAEPCPLSGRTR